MYDVFFLSFDEPMADAHYQRLKDSVPSARRVHGEPGIHAAHRRCASLSRTSHFFVVDADNEVLDADFSLKLPVWDRDYVHLWFARNPINKLEYGWGAVKLFPKALVLAMPQDSLDMTTSLPLKIVPVVKSITHFNYAPFETWRSAFREAVKLTRAQNPEASQRLAVWLTTAQGPFAAYCLRGAACGHRFAQQSDEPHRINDYAWLAEQFAQDTKSHENS